MISKDSNSKPEQMLNAKALLRKSGWRYHLTARFPKSLPRMLPQERKRICCRRIRRKSN